MFDIDPPGPPNAPPDLQPGVVLDVPEKGVPLRGVGARVDGRVCAEVGDWGRDELLALRVRE